MPSSPSTTCNRQATSRAGSTTGVNLPVFKNVAREYRRDDRAGLTRDQWKNMYRITSTIAGTPRIQARKYLPMIVLLSSAN
jgi:hypothetical protein